MVVAGNLTLSGSLLADFSEVLVQEWNQPSTEWNGPGFVIELPAPPPAPPAAPPTPAFPPNLPPPPPASPLLPGVGVKAPSNSDASLGLAIGLSLGGCVLVAVLAAAAFVWYRKRGMQPPPSNASTATPQQVEVTVKPESQI